MASSSQGKRKTQVGRTSALSFRFSVFKRQLVVLIDLAVQLMPLLVLQLHILRAGKQNFHRMQVVLEQQVLKAFVRTTAFAS
jgi:hypothetical protein